MSYGYPAWAPVGKKSGEVLRDIVDGHYAIYTHRKDAEADCPKWGEVRRVYIRVSKKRGPGDRAIR